MKWIILLFSSCLYAGGACSSKIADPMDEKKIIAPQRTVSRDPVEYIQQMPLHTEDRKEMQRIAKSYHLNSHRPPPLVIQHEGEQPVKRKKNRLLVTHSSSLVAAERSA